MKKLGFIVEGTQYEVDFTVGSRKAMEYNYVNKYSISGYADTRPVASNDLPDGRALNRRVDIVIVRNDVTYYNQR